jgi:hypothetical protein
MKRWKHASITAPTIFLSIFLGLAGLNTRAKHYPDAAPVSMSNWQTHVPTVNAPVFDAKGEPLGPEYRALLYAGPSPEALEFTVGPDVVLEDGPIQPAIAKFRSDMPGYFTMEWLHGGNIKFVVDWVWALNVSLGQAASFQVRVWDSRLGTTFEEVQNLGIGGYGESELFQMELKPNLRTVQALTGLESFSLLPVVAESPQFGRVRVLPDGQTEVSVVGPLDKGFALQVSTNLMDWETLIHSTFTDTPMTFLDEESTNLASRFYRIILED